MSSWETGSDRRNKEIIHRSALVTLIEIAQVVPRTYLVCCGTQGFDCFG
jgi:hypothetical protein